MLERQGDVFVFTMDWGENRFGPEGLRAWNEALDAVDQAVAAGGPAALVTTGTGKFYSNGLDLDYLGTLGDGAGAYVGEVLAIYARVLVCPAITIAAMNGHAFGAGGQVALAHDHRVMRAERGFFCMPEIDMRSPLHPGMTAILKARLPKQTVHEVIATGRRYPGPEAAAKGIVDDAVPEAEVLPRSVAWASELASKAHPVLSTLKGDLYPEVLDALKLPLGSVGG